MAETHIFQGMAKSQSFQAQAMIFVAIFGRVFWKTLGFVKSSEQRNYKTLVGGRSYDQS